MCANSLSGLPETKMEEWEEIAKEIAINIASNNSPAECALILDRAKLETLKIYKKQVAKGKEELKAFKKAIS
jgi:hypothetical protein